MAQQLTITLTQILAILSAFFFKLSYQKTYCSGLTDFGDTTPRNVVIAEGQTLLLTCSLNPDLKGRINSSMISFTKTYEPVDMKYVKILDDTRAQLYVPGATVRDAGDYRCLVNQSFVCISDVKVEYLPSSFPVQDFSCLSLRDHLTCSFSRNPSLTYKLIGTTDAGERFYCRYDSAEEEERTSCDWSTASEKQKLPKFKRYVNFTLTLSNRHGTHIQRYYFNRTDLVERKFHQRLIESARSQKVAENVTTRYLSPPTTQLKEKENSAPPNQFNSILVFGITLIASFIFCIIVIFIFFVMYVKYSQIKNFTLKPVVLEDNSDRRADFSDSMLLPNRNIDGSVENEYEEIYDYSALGAHQPFSQSLPETHSEPPNRTEILPPRGLHSASSSSSSSSSSSGVTAASSSPYVTHEQAFSQSVPTPNSTGPVQRNNSSSPYVGWANRLYIPPDSEESESSFSNIGLPVMTLTTQFSNRAYRPNCNSP